jgi:hypothetical protein
MLLSSRGLALRGIVYRQRGCFIRSLTRASPISASLLGVVRKDLEEKRADVDISGVPRPQHAVISTFDLFSIGGVLCIYVLQWEKANAVVLVGPSSSHTVGPMRAGKIFITDLEELDLLDKVCVLAFTLVCVDFKCTFIGPHNKDHLVSYLTSTLRACVGYSCCLPRYGSLAATGKVPVCSPGQQLTWFTPFQAKGTK